MRIALLSVFKEFRRPIMVGIARWGVRGTPCTPLRALSAIARLHITQSREWPGDSVITSVTSAALRAETTARITAQVEAAGRRAAARQALSREKRARRCAGVDARNRRKITRLESA